MKVKMSVGEVQAALSYIEILLSNAHDGLPESFLLRERVRHAALATGEASESASEEISYWIEDASGLQSTVSSLRMCAISPRHPSGTLIKKAIEYLTAIWSLYGRDGIGGFRYGNFESQELIADCLLDLAEFNAEVIADIEIKRTQLPPKLRFSILERDNFRCQICGRDAADRVLLEIDHKIPVSKGGTNEVGNLQVLCRECNIGKSDSLM